MPKHCLFCDNDSGSREHLWPKWIHKRKDFGPLKHQVGNKPVAILSNPEQKVRTVCSTCNSGWMSGLEQQNIPVIGCMFQDVAITLDEAQQLGVSQWGIKTAMVFDSVKGRRAETLFYSPIDCVNMRVSRAIPARTFLWIGRTAMSSLGAFGTDLQIVSPLDGSQLATGIAVTIIMGHLALQILTTRVMQGRTDTELSALAVKPGDWTNMLVQVWPIQRQSVLWPPPISFTKSGRLSIATLMDRWRIGKSLD